MAVACCCLLLIIGVVVVLVVVAACAVVVGGGVGVGVRVVVAVVAVVGYRIFHCTWVSTYVSAEYSFSGIGGGFCRSGDSRRKHANPISRIWGESEIEGFFSSPLLRGVSTMRVPLLN